MSKRLFGLLVFVALCDLLIVIAGGGRAFLRSPVAAAYIVLWNAWWLLVAVGRQRGVRSSYDRGQRAVYALGIGVLLGFVLLVPWEYARWPGPLPRDGALAWLGLAILVAGIVLQGMTFWTLRGLYTSRLGVQPGHRLITAGPYRCVRHPGYLSNLLCLLGISLAMSSLIGLVLTLLTVPLLVRRIADEEAMLQAEFGAAYAAYRSSTRWRLVPYVY